MPPSTDGNGWNEWSRHVLAELERLNGCYEGLRVSVEKIHVEIAMLKVKSGAWGALGGAIPVIIGLGVWAITKLAK